MLIFDPKNGLLLGYEETLTSDPGKLNVRTPAVIQYIAFESAKYVDLNSSHLANGLLRTPRLMEQGG